MLRALAWIPKALSQYATRNPVPQAYWEILSPTFDAFGTSRIGERQQENLLGPLGGLEIAHSRVPIDVWRWYLSLTYQHNDLLVATRDIFPARLIATGPGAFISPVRDMGRVPAGFALTVRNVSVGPGDFIAAEATSMGVAARLAITVVWIDVPIGETLPGIV